jgi:hypothetical protein
MKVKRGEGEENKFEKDFDPREIDEDEDFLEELDLDD